MNNSKKMIIVGITGTLGAGKGTIVDFLVHNKNFKHYSVRGFLLKLIKEKGLPENRDSMVKLANELRQKHGSSYIVEQLFLEANTSNSNTIIESIRNVGEIEALKKLGNFILIAVDADAKTRYHRIVSRGSETDNISFEEFIKNEEREMNSTDANAQNIKACMDRADIVFDNSGDFENLYKQINDYIINTEI